MVFFYLIKLKYISSDLDVTPARMGRGAKFGHNFGLTISGQLKLKLYCYFCYYDLELRTVSGTGRRKLRPNLAFVLKSLHLKRKSLIRGDLSAHIRYK